MQPRHLYRCLHPSLRRRGVELVPNCGGTSAATHPIRTVCLRPVDPYRLAAMGFTAAAAPLRVPKRWQGSTTPPTHGGGNSAGTSPTTGAATPAGDAGPPPLEALLEELRLLVNRPVPIGTLFRSLSPAGRKILVAHRVPLEQLLLRYPHMFAVYSTGSKKKCKVITVSPLDQVPLDVTRMYAPGGGGDGAATQQASSNDTLNLNPDQYYTGKREIIPLQERILKVLAYIPNEFSPFTELDVPTSIKYSCMDYPNVKPMAFFQSHPKYFEVRNSSLSEPSFLVRRAIGLQRQLEEDNKNAKK